MDHPRAPNGTLNRKVKMTVWPFSRLWRAPGPTLFQMTLVAALLATVLGDCGPPPYLDFASPLNEINETNYKTGTALKYTCRPGYSKTRSNYYVTCTRGGRWSYENFCIKRKCSNPGELHNGEVIVNTDFSFGSKIEFNCLEGYILIGPTSSHCEIQDKTVGWSNSFPQCVIAECQPPPHISHGKHNAVNEEAHTYGSSVTYSCDPGFAMLGEASIACRVQNKTKGVWSPSPPTCKKITCSQPEVKHGKVISGFGRSYTYKDSITFECNRGFVLRGSNIIRCGADNDWDPPPPVCETYTCPGLPDILHASWEAYGYRKPTKEEPYEVGTVLNYRCHPGFKAAGNKPTTVTCQRDLSWTPHVECEEVCCPEPELKNGKIIQQRKSGRVNNCAYFYGDSILYLCPGRRNSEASCQGDGTWNPVTPTCEESCSFPPDIDHGRHKQISGRFQRMQVKYECDEGYALVGKPTLSCSNSRWSDLAPQCKALCLKPEIEHGSLFVDKDQFTESENATIQCDSGYAVVGPQSITCLENRTWFPEVPKCEWEVPQGCKQVLAGRNLTQCLPRVEDVKMALEIYKLSLEIELLELRIDKERKSTPEL